MAIGIIRASIPPIAPNKTSIALPNITIIPMATNIMKMISIILSILYYHKSNDQNRKNKIP
tara:strand:+ start:111 stop:293 length:183 start_codon:yes stop_codon:yes gene_type:complete